jgi:hypothetical protein
MFAAEVYPWLSTALFIGGLTVMVLMAELV